VTRVAWLAQGVSPEALFLPEGIDCLSTTTRSDPPTDEHERRERLAGLLAGCAQRHEKDLEELYGLYSAQLYGVLLRILRIEAIAEEALQESFVKIWEKADSYSPAAGSPMAWMNSIARHQALDVLRQRRSRENFEAADTAGWIDATPDASKPLHEMSADAQLLLRCLDRLPEAARDCIVKAYCEGYSHDELSADTKVPLGTVKSWIRRGLVSLRKCIDEHS